MKIIAIAVLIMVMSIAGGIMFSYSGLIDVSANSQEPAVIQWLLANTRKNSILSRSRNIKPPILTDMENQARGGKGYSELCASCHGAPGQKPFLGASEMNPPPPDLASIANSRSPEELFWVVKNGIRMTGMPAWGKTHTDEQIWDMVAFVKRLPGLSSVSYKNMIESVKDDGHDHEHGESMKTVTDENADVGNAYDSEHNDDHGHDE
jgi:mono/diheme cytochrome c family protein